MSSRCIIIFMLIYFTKVGFGQSFFIGEITQTLNDPARSNRAIETKIFYPAIAAGANQPAAQGVFPLVVVGHGFSMTYDAYKNFWEELVPQGYIVALPTTESAIIPFPSHGDFGADLAFVVSYFQTENANASSVFYEKLTDKAAIMGHSMGGGATFLAAANNPNITTIVGFAPAETNPSAVAAAANISVPALVFIGSKDNVAGAVNNATPIYNALGSECKTYITITDGNHCRFANQNITCELGESTVCAFCTFIDRQTQHDITFQFLNLWLEFFLKGECAGYSQFQMLLNSSNDITFQQSCNITKPVSEFNISGDTVFCKGDSVILTGQGSYDFLWSTGDSNSSISIDQTGDYYLIAKDEYNCTDTSGTISIQANTPVIPQLSIVGDSLIANNISGVINWFKDDSLLSGENNSFLVPVENGNYYIEVVDNNSCLAKSNTIAFVISAIIDPEKSSSLFYPNPVRETLFIKSDFDEIRIIDVTGHVLIRDSKTKKQINLGNLKAGIYFIVIKKEGQNNIYKLLKN